MNQPTTALWEKTHLEDWRKWVTWRLRQNDWDNVNHAIKVILTETKGCMNPKIIKELY